MSIVLMGMKHCGKSTLARRLAEATGRRFYDTDDVLEETYRRRTGARYSCREIFSLHGEAYWDGLELAAVQTLAERLALCDDEAVIALGGRTAMNPEAQPIVRKLGTTVLLDVDVDELYRRVAAGGIPPFLDPADPAGSFARLCEQRLAVYRQLAEVVVPLTGLSPDEALQELRKQLAEQSASQEK
ncbi:MAG: shikimate kinase [Phycisphaerae bacterium]